MNQTVRRDDLDEIRHYGVVGMKWGKTLRRFADRSLAKQTSKVIRRYDRGRADREEVSKVGRHVRNERYKLTKKIARAEKYLAKADKADAAGLINRFNKNPEKRAMVKDYMDTMKTHMVNMDNYRMQLMDARL